MNVTLTNDEYAQLARQAAESGKLTADLAAEHIRAGMNK